MGAETVLCGNESQSGIVPGKKKRMLKLRSSCSYAPELQGMGISIIVVEDPELKWRLRKISEVIDDLVYMIQSGMRSPFSKGKDVALDV